MGFVLIPTDQALAVICSPFTIYRLRLFSLCAMLYALCNLTRPRDLYTRESM